MILRFLILISLVLPIVGCATPDTIGPVTYRAHNGGYDRFVLTSSGTFSGAETKLFLKRLQNGQNLEICGFYLATSGMHQDLTSKWLSQAVITIDGEEIVSSRFLQPQSNELDAKAACVVTTTLYKPELLSQEIRIRGGKIRGYY